MCADTPSEALPPDSEEYVAAARLIAGATHEVNNALGAIMAFAELISLDLDASPEVQRRLDDIIALVEKSTGTLDTLSSLVATRRTEVSEVDVARLVTKVADLHRHQLKTERIQFELEGVGSRMPLIGVKGALCSVFALLLRDSILRLRDADRKTIRVKLYADEQAVHIRLKDSAEERPDLSPQKNTALTIAQAHTRAHKGEIGIQSDGELYVEFPRENGLKL